MTKFLTSLILTLATTAVMAPVAFAEKLDTETNTLVIDKLEHVLDSIENTNPSRAGIMVRLADLYSERARLYAIDELQKKCTKCDQSKKDRVRALELYEGVFPKAQNEQKGKILLQMAHLYEILEKPGKAQDLYASVIKAGSPHYQTNLIGQSHTGLGDFLFRKLKYKEAQTHYQKAIDINDTPRRAYVTSRLAWCDFHLDKITEATKLMTSVLTHPDQMVRSVDGKLDSSFHEETSRDLATFLSRTEVTAKEVRTLSDLSPENTRKDNLTYLATELDRLGKKNSALIVWKVVGEDRRLPKDRIDGFIKVARLQYDVSHKAEVVSKINQAMKVWKKDGCEPADECEIIRGQLHSLLMNWGKAEENTPSKELVQAFGLYTTYFTDVEMNYWAAGSARMLNQFNTATQFYRTAASQAYNELGNKSGKSADEVAKTKKIFEGSLLGEIEVAELSKNNQARDLAYDHYLELNPNGDKALDVRYQKVHILYENSKYDAAAEGFRSVALTQNSNTELRTKSADLALDSLVLAKNDLKIESWAMEFADKFPTRRTEYVKVARKAILNNVALSANSSNASQNNEGALLAKLNLVRLDGATHDEKVSYYKNKIVLAERSHNLTEYQKATEGLLQLPGLTKEEKEFAMARKAWLAEMTLNFNLAYFLSQKMPLKELSPEERILKLAVLAELSGNNPDKYYAQFLKTSPHHPKAQSIMAEMVRSSQEPLKTFRKYQSELIKNPTLYSQLALEIFAKNRDYGFAKEMALKAKVQNTNPGATLVRFAYLKEFASLADKVGEHKLNIKSSRALNESLTQRLALISQLERQAQHAAKTGDWVLQVVTLRPVAEENERVYNDILASPAPKGLNAKQKADYRVALTKQAASFKNKSLKVDSKINELWAKSDSTTQLAQEANSTQGPLRALILDEVRVLTRVAPLGEQKTLKNILSSQEASPSSKVIQEARSGVQENPFNVSKIEKLKSLEERAGRITMASYLGARLNQLQVGDRK